MAIGARHLDRRKDAFANAVTSMILLMIGLGIFCIAPLKKTQGCPVSRRVRRVRRTMRRNLRRAAGEGPHGKSNSRRARMRSNGTIVRPLSLLSASVPDASVYSRMEPLRRCAAVLFAPRVGARIARSPASGFFKGSRRN